jgi:hypothetical protein
MQEAVRQRLDLAKEMFRRPWFRNLLLVWATISVLDTFVSEMLPEKIAANAPRVYKVLFWLLEMTSGWMPLWGWLLIGMSLLVVGNIEFAFRITREDKLRRSYLQQPSAGTEKGRLDYLVEGLQAMNDITNALSASNGDTTRIGNTVNRYAKLLPFISNPKLKRQLLSRLARHINYYCDKVQRTAEFIGAATPMVSENQIKYIEGSTIGSEREKPDLRAFIQAILVTGSTVPQTVNGFEGMRTAAGSVKGTTGDLNAASSRLYIVVGGLIDTINGFGAACEQMQKAANSKLATAEKASG